MAEESGLLARIKAADPIPLAPVIEEDIAVREKRGGQNRYIALNVIRIQRLSKEGPVGGAVGQIKKELADLGVHPSWLEYRKDAIDPSFVAIRQLVRNYPVLEEAAILEIPRSDNKSLSDEEIMFLNLVKPIQEKAETALLILDSELRFDLPPEADGAARTLKDLSETATEIREDGGRVYELTIRKNWKALKTSNLMPLISSFLRAI